MSVKRFVWSFPYLSFDDVSVRIIQWRCRRGGGGDASMVGCQYLYVFAHCCISTNITRLDQRRAEHFLARDARRRAHLLGPSGGPKLLPRRPAVGLVDAEPGDRPCSTSGIATGSSPRKRLSRFVRLAFLMASLLCLAWSTGISPALQKLRTVARSPSSESLSNRARHH